MIEMNRPVTSRSRLRGQTPIDELAPGITDFRVFFVRVIEHEGCHAHSRLV